MGRPVYLNLGKIETMSMSSLCKKPKYSVILRLNIIYELTDDLIFEYSTESLLNLMILPFMTAQIAHCCIIFLKQKKYEHYCQ